MATLAQSQLDVPLSATAASESLCTVLQEQGYELEDGSVPGSAELIFNAKRTVLYTRRQGGARITDNGNGNGNGSTIELGIDVAPGQATGLMDGKRNRRLMEELTERISASLGSV